MAEHDFQYGESLHKVSIETPNGVVEIAAASYAGIPFFVESIIDCKFEPPPETNTANFFIILFPHPFYLFEQIL